MPLYRNGQSVQYKPIGGPEGPATESVGTIRSVLTHPGSQANRNVNASEDQPRYEVENQHTGKTTTVYERNIMGPAE